MIRFYDSGRELQVLAMNPNKDNANDSPFGNGFLISTRTETETETTQRVIITK